MDDQPSTDSFTTSGWAGGPRPATYGRSNPQSRSRGQMTILFAVMATALLAFVALAIDGGFAFSQRRSMQNAADAGTLAGTRELAARSSGNPITDNQVRDRVFAAVTGNGWNPSRDTITATYITTRRVEIGTVGQYGAVAPPDLARGVAVTTTAYYPTFFGGFIGIDRLSSWATARSMWGYTCTARCVFPLIIRDVSLWVGETAFQLTSNAAGNFGWLCWVQPCGDPQLQGDLQSILDGNCPGGTITQGQWVGGNAGGNFTSGTGDLIMTGWVNKTPERPVYIPTFGPGPGPDPPGGPGFCTSNPGSYCPDGVYGTGANSYYLVTGFIEVLITGVTTTGNPKRIDLVYKEGVGDGQVTANCNRTSGLKSINLIR